MSADDWSRFAAATREYAEADDALELPLEPLGTYEERYRRQRAAAKRYRREVRRLGFEPPTPRTVPSDSE